MPNILEEFKKKYFKTTCVFDKKIVFDTTKKINSLDKIDILSDVLYSINDVEMCNIDQVKNDINKGVDKKTAIKREIETWNSEIVDLLIKKFFNICSDLKHVDFTKNEELRIYWKLLKIFKKEEIDNFTQFEWEWAVYNLYQDEIEQDQIDDRKLEKRKPWYNVDLFNYITKKKNEDKQRLEQEKNILKNIIKQNNNINNDLTIELIDAEDNDLPTIIEENNNARK